MFIGARTLYYILVLFLVCETDTTARVPRGFYVLPMVCASHTAEINYDPNRHRERRTFNDRTARNLLLPGRLQTTQHSNSSNNANHNNTNSTNILAHIHLSK